MIDAYAPYAGVIDDIYGIVIISIGEEVWNKYNLVYYQPDNYEWQKYTKMKEKICIFVYN